MGVASFVSKGRGTWVGGVFCFVLGPCALILVALTEIHLQVVRVGWVGKVEHVHRERDIMQYT